MLIFIFFACLPPVLWFTNSWSKACDTAVYEENIGPYLLHHLICAVLMLGLYKFAH